MKSLYDVPAPAKLNLFLHITGRRADGYHLLQSAFMLIDWCDTLHFERRNDGQISREDLTQALPADDLITRAARALQTLTQCPLGAHISVEKQIPAQAGMGGGSSDAASCLLALNRLWNLNLTVSQLAPLALGLGADVPFFLHGRNAWVEGIGEKITPLTLPPSRFLVVKPPAGIDTKTIFADADLTRDTKPATIEGFAEHPYCFGSNNLQPVALKHCIQINQAIEWLETIGLRARMTGSGSAVFAQMLDNADIDSAPSTWQVRLCSNLLAHPLRGWAGSDD
jgi:4-diphosphocytidyl-2-C-methyl-D-erythritol kinase